MPSTPEQRRRLLFYFMSGDPKGKGDYNGQLKVWISYLYNIPEDAIPNIIDKYIATHATVDRAVERTGGESGLVHQLFYNEEFFQKLNAAGKQAFLEITVDDVLAVLKTFCRKGTCRKCGKSHVDMTNLKDFKCDCGGSATPDFPKLITIARCVQKHKDWFGQNLSHMLQRMRAKYMPSGSGA